MGFYEKILYVPETTFLGIKLLQMSLASVVEVRAQGFFIFRLRVFAILVSSVSGSFCSSPDSVVVANQILDVIGNFFVLLMPPCSHY